jgi:uncharacterized cupin superfamily protein
MTNQTPISPQDIPANAGSSYPEPLNSRMGQADWRALGDHFGLTQFGLNYETLQPGAESAARHWHTLADEFIYMLEGELVLHTDAGETALSPGMCIGFKAADPNGHHLVNRSSAQARFLVVGARIPGDNAFYPDDDLAWMPTPDGKIAVHKDGSPYPKK